jgi:urease accessory protein
MGTSTTTVMGTTMTSEAVTRGKARSTSAGHDTALGASVRRAPEVSCDAPALTHAALYQLLAWSSPGYPTGAFSYSHGLEWAVETGSVTDLPTLLDYITAVLARGGAWIDAVLFAHAWRLASPTADASPAPAPAFAHAPAALVSRADAAPADPPRNRAAHTPSPAGLASSDREAQLDALSQLATAFRGSAETALESRQQGSAFLDVNRKAWPHAALDAFAQHQAGAPVAHCIAVALACAAHNIALVPALHCYLHAVAANLVSAGARLIPLGQTQAQIAIAQLSATITEIVERALTTSLDDLGTAAPLAEICSFLHETQYTRLFRS